MEIVNIHDAKTRLSALIAAAVQGKPFIIAKSGKPLVKVEALAPVDSSRRSRLGGMRGKLKIPDNFNSLGETEIEAMFYGSDGWRHSHDTPPR